MKNKSTVRLLAGLGLFAAMGLPSTLAALSVSAGHTPSDLVDELLPVSTSISFSGATIGLTASGGLPSNSQIGKFSGGSSANNLPFSSGVVLTTGRLASASGTTLGNNGILGPNDHVRTTHVWTDSTGDQILADEFGVPIGQTADAASLTFDFQSTASAFSFQYMFASEEYPENVNALNDAFGFFLIDKNGSSNPSLWNITNLALLPGNTPVSINTVNNGPLNSGPGVNLPYFNANPFAAPLYDIEFDGMAGGFFATKLFATATIIPNHDYTIHIVIHDVGDSLGDSAVFIGADSFVDVPFNPVPEPSTYIGALSLAALMFGKLRRKA